ncbi:MAG: PHP domain-containing protein [Clostridia bacterium]|nr:PHP domain-containing protein [Clostridia bacterium]
MKCDLHTHSIYSDGSYSPAEIIAEAKRLNLTVALTDHNTTAGLKEFMQAAKEQGAYAVSGVELSTVYRDKELHLLGLFISPEHYDRVEMLVNEFRVLKESSNIKTVERLNAAGYNISFSDVKRRTKSGNVNRAHIAAELCEKGYVNSINEAFETLLAKRTGFYEPPKYLEIMDAIKFLRGIKAVPVLAHPLKDLDKDELRRFLPCAIDAGLIGMETQHSSYDCKKTALASQIAKEFGLLQSGGSDFHGTNKPDVSLGIPAMPVEIYNALLAVKMKF